MGYRQYAIQQTASLLKCGHPREGFLLLGSGEDDRGVFGRLTSRSAIPLSRTTGNDSYKMPLLEPGRAKENLPRFDCLAFSEKPVRHAPFLGDRLGVIDMNGGQAILQPGRCLEEKTLWDAGRRI